MEKSIQRISAIDGNKLYKNNKRGILAYIYRNTIQLTKKKFNNEMMYMYMCMRAYVLKKEFQQYAEKVSQKY